MEARAPHTEQQQVEMPWVKAACGGQEQQATQCVQSMSPGRLLEIIS